ncbi:MAG: acyl-CoA desaturase [Schleiferiaceae bacterium]|jgi:linoleoyl-CoA desaturase|nr:MAG: fatty acid desaturase [Cryomorphaceae bacterium BACL23 MAG-120924-bin60]MDP5067743.1 acyl-CoA desaturase [Schleiferiaceae bacterium]
MSEIPFRAPRFAPKAGQPFYQELTKRVNAYFTQNNLSPKGNYKLYVKTGVLIGGFLAAYLGLVLAAPGFEVAWMLWLALGLLTAAIGFNIMHDGAHGSFSKHNWLNEMAGHSVNFLGASILMWKTKHNTVHHTFTNIEGVDDDIDAGAMLRMAPSQERRGFHRFQHLYFSGLYAMLYIYWVVYTDYKKYFSGKVGNVPIPKLTRFQHISFWAWKALHLGLFVGLPMWKLGVLPWFGGFMLMGMSAGLVLSMVFQLAHVVTEASFTPYVHGETLETEEEWAIHQIKTTANFATKSRFLTWFLGGLNFQVEHHLFPRISHVHYPDLAKIVKQTCDEFNVTYTEFKTFASAVRSHVQHLRMMGQMA